MKDISHICRKRITDRCHLCGELLPLPLYCSLCGMDISDIHTCQPKPSHHVCRPLLTRNRCFKCGILLPAPIYCTICGGGIFDSHLCDDDIDTNNFLGSLNKHICISQSSFICCTSCKLPLPAPFFCSLCGKDISEPHICPPKPQKHFCRPQLKMSCLRCGKILPPPVYCNKCGMDISEVHECFE